MDSEFRQLSDRERGLLERILEAKFLGRDELRAQLCSISAKQIEDDGTLSLRCASGHPSPAKYRLVAEASCNDADGGQMSVMLHLNGDGYMSMLEIVKYGDASILNPPSARNLMLLLPEDGGEKQN